MNNKMQPLGPADLQAYMQQNAIPGEILHLDAPTPTVEVAAKVAGVKVEQIVKSILFLINNEGVMTITCGTTRVERRAVAVRYGVGRKRVKLANAEAVLKLTGYAVGTVPPFGHPNPIPTLLDPRVLEHSEVYAGGGAHNALVRLNPEVILGITEAEVLDLLMVPK